MIVIAIVFLLYITITAFPGQEQAVITGIVTGILCAMLAFMTLAERYGDK